MKRATEEGRQDRLAAAFCGVGSSADASQPTQRVAREFFTLDLRGLRAALTARAAASGMTESDVLRSALAVALRDDSGATTIPTPGGAESSLAPPLIKLSSRLTRAAAERLDRNARAAGLSRGAYLTRLIDGAPPVTASADRASSAAALSASAAEVALLSRDLSHLTHLLRQGNHQAATPYRERLDTLDADMRAHLDRAAAVLAELSPPRTGTRRRHPLDPHRRSSP